MTLQQDSSEPGAAGERQDVVVRIPRGDWDQIVSDIENMCGQSAEHIEILQSAFVTDDRPAVGREALGTAAAKAIIYNLPVDGFGQSKRLEEYAAIWGNAAADAMLALINGSTS